MSAYLECLDEALRGVRYPRVPNPLAGDIAEETIKVAPVKLDDELSVKPPLQASLTDGGELVIPASASVGLALAEMPAVQEVL